MTTVGDQPTTITKDSPEIVESADYDIVCGRCGGHDFRVYLSWRDMDGMDDGPGEYIIPEERRRYYYVCRSCDWKLMNGYPVEYSDEEYEDDRERARQLL